MLIIKGILTLYSAESVNSISSSPLRAKKNTMKDCSRHIIALKHCCEKEFRGVSEG